MCNAPNAFASVGFNASSESEGFDRTFGLPWGQDILINTIARSNPRTIVTLTAGGGVDCEPWVERVPALLHTWYTGQEVGTALADVLFGAYSPEGKLPVTIDRAWRDNPVMTRDTIVSDPVTGGTKLAYGEGMLLGYRYYTTVHKAPRFAFGFGLGYTTFSMTRLRVPPSASARSGVTVSVDVTNTGQRTGAEVVQVYVGNRSSLVERPAKELRAFQKIRLRPGERRRVWLHLDRRAFAYFDVRSRAWQVEPGNVTLFVGNSSDQLPLTATIELSQ
jgi:beta-glucosidase